MGLQDGWGRVSGNHQGRANCVSQVSGSQILCPPCSVVCQRRVQKRSNGLCQKLCLGEGCSPAPTLMPVTSFPPRMPLVHFKLLPWCWSSAGKNMSKSVCGPFKRNCLGIQQFLLLTQSSLVFVARSHGDLASQSRNPGLGTLM